jgi:hypothetical protein
MLMELEVGFVVRDLIDLKLMSNFYSREMVCFFNPKEGFEALAETVFSGPFFAFLAGLRPRITSSFLGAVICLLTFLFFVILGMIPI